MTRVNCVPVEELSDSHLMAEHREIVRVSKLARPLKPGEVGPYTLGKGHVKFFYDKGAWMQSRYESIYAECKSRGLNVTYWGYRPHPDGLNGHWEPSEGDREVNRGRIRERIAANPKHHRWSKK